MDLRLKRTDKREDGVFGQLFRQDTGDQIACTLEHSYDAGLGDGSYTSKIPNGTYECVRGMHRLHNMKEPFETFEITGIKGHTNILFHVGNFNNDSEGCVLVGGGYGGDPRMLYDSRRTFTKLMNLQYGVDKFTLIVE